MADTPEQPANTPAGPPTPAPPAQPAPPPAPPSADTPASPAAPPAPVSETSGLTLGDAPSAPEPAPRLSQPEPPDANGNWWGTGRRKKAVARVRIKQGSGSFLVQVSRKKTKTIDEYFTEIRDRNDAFAPLEACGLKGSLDVVARCDGGGFMGQAQAVRLGLARAIKKFDPTHEATLREHGFLTRDPREVERKKYGQPGARRRFQFSKR